MRPALLNDQPPSPDPTTLNDAHPVLSRFVVHTPDTPAPSYDTPSLIDDALTPAVTPTRNVPDTPLAARHTTD
eukprot:1599093-Rhodomonas_salina.1